MDTTGKGLTGQELIAYAKVCQTNTRLTLGPTVWGAIVRRMSGPGYGQLSANKMVEDLYRDVPTMTKGRSDLERALRQAIGALNRAVEGPVEARKAIPPIVARSAPNTSRSTDAPELAGVVAEYAAVSDQAIKYAQSAMVETCMAPETQVLYAGSQGLRESVPKAGYSRFGDGVIRGDVRAYMQLDNAWQINRDMYEGVAFVPVMTDVTEPQSTVVKGGLFRRDKTVTTNVPRDPIPVMIKGPNGEEPAVRVGYAFDPHGHSISRADLPDHRDYSNRGGTSLTLEMVLPESVANDLKGAIVARPEFARTFAERFVLKRGGLDPASWSGEGKAVALKPPWSKVPPEQRIDLVTATGDGPLQVRPLPEIANRTTKGQSVEELTKMVDHYDVSGTLPEMADRRTDELTELVKRYTVSGKLFDPGAGTPAPGGANSAKPDHRQHPRKSPTDNGKTYG